VYIAAEPIVFAVDNIQFGEQCAPVLKCAMDIAEGYNAARA
jgi:hypothetical protein